MKFDFKFMLGNVSNDGYRHFPILWFAYGTNGFSMCILGCNLTIKLW